MAAPIRSTCFRWQNSFKSVLSKISGANGHKIVSLTTKHNAITVSQRSFSFNGGYGKFTRSKFKFIGGVGAFVCAAVGIKVACEGNFEKPSIKPSRSIVVPTDSSGLKLTLYQFQSCPFCCKVRATLDYYGLSYDVIEVNSVLKTEIKWSKYRKVPILIVEGAGNDQTAVQLNDSSVIMSVLETFHLDKTQSVGKLKEFYPEIEVEDNKGKNKKDFGNKYFVMCQDLLKDCCSLEERKEERTWRQWVDADLVHVLSPNAYRTPREAIQAFNHFSEVGEWEKNFSYPMRIFIIFTGASVMYFVSKLLKRRYNLKDDVRESLCDRGEVWVNMVKKNGKFLGGDKPNLADLSVYGVLSSIEGCDCFEHMMANTEIGPWYKRTKEAVQSHGGAGYFMS